MNLRYITLLFVTLFMSHSLFGQIQFTDPEMTPIEAVQDVLMGNGVVATNITVNGSPVNAQTAQSYIQRFNSNGTNFGIAEGILLKTSTAPSVAGDADLNAIAQAPPYVTNGVIIEFDFVPQGDTLSFNYIFSSAEYTSFTCSNYNDVFGFFISGPGINGPYSNNSVNIATIPGSNNIPVGINTVNSGNNADPSGNCASANPNWQADAQYWTSSYNTAFGSLGFNGSTIVLPAGSATQCNQTYHIKMAIANVSDTGFDSGVFLEANSFSSDAISVDIKPTVSSFSDTMLIEGCTEGIVHFTRPADQTDQEIIVHFNVGGTATQGVDFPPLADGDSIVFLVGEDSVSLAITPIQDGLVEGPESVIISTFFVNVCGDTVYNEGTIWIDDEPYSTVTSTDTTRLCFNDSIPLWAETDHGFPPYEYSWSNGEEGANVFGSVMENGDIPFIVTSTDACGFEYMDTAWVHMNQTLVIDSLVQIPADCGEDNGAVIGYGTPSNYHGTPHFTWSMDNEYGSPSTSSTAWPNRPAGWYYFAIEDDVCRVEDSILVEQTPPPTASFTADPMSGFSPLDVDFTNTSDPATSYHWDFGNGEEVTVGDLSGQSSTYTEEGVYTVVLTVTEGGCSDQATAQIIVEEYLPMNYEIPNVFTPNGDSENDFFKLISHEHIAGIKVQILNRWGNLVFEDDVVGFAWNGKVKNTGAECADGTYFYKMEMTDLYGEIKVEQGFLHLNRGK